MRLHTSKAVAACASALALALPLTACSSDEEGASGGLSTASEAPGAADTDADGDGEPDAADPNGNNDGGDADADGKGGQGGGNNAGQGGGNNQGGNNAGQGGGNGEIPQIANPFENGMPENTNQPLANGKEGSEKDRKQMEDAARAVLNPDSFGGWTRTILDNSCSAVTDEMMQQLDAMGLSLEQIEEASRMAEQQGQGLTTPKADVSISDVRVDGNRASASLTAKSDGQEQTEVMIFEKEDGRWKLCR